MRPKENIEKFVRVGKPRVTTSRQMDKRTLDDSFEAMEQTIRTKSADHKPSVPRIIFQSRMIKLTATAAVIIVAIGLISLFVHQGPDEQIGYDQSPTKMMSAISLTMAYRRGGIDTLDEQCEKAIRMLGPRPLHLTLGQLLSENNG
ncbi:MAG: hypothetical protein OEW48_14360 [Phycisphaerae bacterium]|nr:hypothetical protein [Phycisphaerae bacterium]